MSASVYQHGRVVLFAERASRDMLAAHMHRSLALLLLAVSSGLAEPRRTLESDFRTPPVTARPRGLWAWVNGNFDHAEITREMEEAKAKGMGGFDIWDISPVVDDEKVVPPGEPFMSPAYVKAIAHAAREAKRLGLDLGLTIASGWNAGGSWVKPEHATLGLFRSERVVDGPGVVKLDLPYPELPKEYGNLGPALIERGPDGKPVFSQEVAVLAFPEEPGFPTWKIAILTGRSEWNAPTGKWRIVRYVCTNTGQPMFSHAASSNGPMIDHMNPAATEAHVNHFLSKLRAELGDLRTSGLSYLYTDSYEVRGDLWTPRLPEEFKRRTGYDLIPYLPVLQGRIISSKEMSDRFRFDYAKVLSDLVIEGHYMKATDMAHAAGIQFAAEAAGPGQPIHNCPFESLKSSGSLDIPRGEFWHKFTGKNGDILQVVRGVASAAHIYGQKYVEAESFTSVWMWQEGLAELKATADKAFCEGLNRIIYHTFPHTPRAAGAPGWVYSFGTQISELQPWWPLSKPFHDYLARVSHMLQQGNFVGDALVYYGDQAPNFAPPNRWDPRLGFGHDFDYVNSDVLVNRLEVRDGRLVLPNGQSYAVLVLPDTDRMSVEVARKLEKLVDAGAKVFGPQPQRTFGLFEAVKRDAELRGIVRSVWPRVKPYSEIAGALPPADVQSADAASLDYIHRRTATEDIYFLRNTTDRELSTTVQFRVDGRVAQFWDPITGAGRPAANGARVPVELGPYGSVFVVFRAGAPQRIPQAPKVREEIAIEVPGSWPAGFSGVHRYEVSFDAPRAAQQVALDLGKVGMVARVSVNGTEAGTAWHPPYRVDITKALKAGANKLVIEVANTFSEALIADSKQSEPRLRSNIRKLPNSWMFPMQDLPNDKYQPPFSGLGGPVKLLVY